MNKVSLRKKIQLYLTYRKTLEKNRENLFQNFTSRIDRVYRIYTVINLPKEEMEEPYNFRKRDLDIFAEKYIREYSQNIAQYLNSLGLNELYDILFNNKNNEDVIDINSIQILVKMYKIITTKM